MALKILPLECEIEDCSLYSTRDCIATEIVRPRGYDAESREPIDLLIIGEQPSKIDAAQRRAYAGYTGELVKRILNLGVGISPNGHAFTHLIRCRALNDDGTSRSPSGDEIRLCHDYLVRDLRRLKPRVLVIQGMRVLKALKPEIDAEKMVYNRILDVTIEGKTYPAVVTIDPRTAAQNTSVLSLLIAGVVKAQDIAEHGERSMYHPSRWMVESKIDYCDTVEKVERMVDHLLHETEGKLSCAFDVETRNLNATHGNALVTLQFCVDPQHVFVVPYNYIHGPFDDNDRVRIKAALKRLFTEKPGFRYWATHFGLFEQLQVMEFILDGKSFVNVPMIDTMGCAYILDENRVEAQKLVGQGLSIKDLAPEQIGRDTYEDAAVEARAAGELWKLPPELLLPYAADDVINTSLLLRFFRMQAKSTGYLDEMMKLSEHLFGAAFRLFAKLKRNGFFVDLQHLRLLASKDSPILKRMDEIERYFKTCPEAIQTNKMIMDEDSGGQTVLFGKPWKFNINKPRHRQVLFIDVMGLEPLKSKKTGPSIDKTFYEAYGEAYEPVKHTAEYVSLKKLSTSYAKAILEYVDPSCTSFKDEKAKQRWVDCCWDSRVRADFGFTNTVTGRPSCLNPNIQNVPRADNEAKAAIKSMFAAQQSYGAWRPGKKVERVLKQLDFMANEVRWWALISGDNLLAEALRRGKAARDAYRRNPTPETKKHAKLQGDIHAQTASLMFNVPVEKVDKKMRQNTKAIVFALIYGGGPKLIAARTKNDNLDEVIELCNKFARSVPVGNKWLKKIEVFAAENLMVESPLNRRRHLWEFITDDEMAIAKARRLARNSPIQGVASDACIIGASMWMDYIEQHNKDWKIVNVVHDSCVTELPIDDIEEAAAVAEKCFTTDMMDRITDVWGVDFICPLEVEFDFGVRWGDMAAWDFSVDSPLVKDGKELSGGLKAIHEWLREGGVK